MKRVLRDAARGQRPFDLASLSLIASRPAALIVIEVVEKREPCPDLTFPARDIDRVRELAKRVRHEVALPARS